MSWWVSEEGEGRGREGLSTAGDKRKKAEVSDKGQERLLPSLPGLIRHAYFFCDCYGVLRPGPSRHVYVCNSLARTMLQQSEISSQGFNKLPNHRAEQRAGCGDRERKELKIWRRGAALAGGAGAPTWAATHGPVLALLMLPLGPSSGGSRGQARGSDPRPALWLQQHAAHLLSLLTPLPALTFSWPPPGVGEQSR